MLKQAFPAVNVPIAQVFNEIRQAERMNYETTTNKQNVIDFINNVELPRIEQLDKDK